MPHVSCMYPACLLHSYQIRLSLDAFEIHVSHNVSQMYPLCILITSADTCIPNISCMYLASQIRTSLDTKKSLRKKGSQPSAKVHTSHKKEWRVLSAHGGDASIIVVLSNRM